VEGAGVEGRLLQQFAGGRRDDALARPQEAAGQGELAGERRVPALDQQHLEAAVAHGEDHQVDGQAQGLVVTSGHGTLLCFMSS
jgi:hypothetical protein